MISRQQMTTNGGGFAVPTAANYQQILNNDEEVDFEREEDASQQIVDPGANNQEHLAHPF